MMVRDPSVPQCDVLLGFWGIISCREQTLSSVQGVGGMSVKGPFFIGRVSV